MKRGSIGVFALDQIAPFRLLAAGASMAGLWIAWVIILLVVIAKRDADLCAAAQLYKQRLLALRYRSRDQRQKRRNAEERLDHSSSPSSSMRMRAAAPSMSSY